jgi:hypothetical protein
MQFTITAQRLVRGNMLARIIEIAVHNDTAFPVRQTGRDSLSRVLLFGCPLSDANVVFPASAVRIAACARTSQ